MSRPLPPTPLPPCHCSTCRPSRAARVRARLALIGFRAGLAGLVAALTFLPRKGV